MPTTKAWLGALALVGAAGTQAQDLPSHCQAPDVLVWSCRAGAEVYSLCATQGLDASQGTLQFRQGALGAVVWRHPQDAVRPREAFQFGLMAQGVELSFVSKRGEHAITEDIKGATVVHHPATTAAKAKATVCDAASETLALTRTMRWFEALGIVPRGQALTPTFR